MRHVLKKSGPKGDDSGLKNNMGLVEDGGPKILVHGGEGGGGGGGGDCLPRDIRKILLGFVLGGPFRKPILRGLACARGPFS